MKKLAQLQALCNVLGLDVQTRGRPAKEPYVQALQLFLWDQAHPGEPLPVQIDPMLLGSWNDLDDEDIAAIEADGSGWCVQEKFDGIRTLLHIEEGRVRLTGRNLSDTTFRQTEFQHHASHLTQGLWALAGTVLDGELICPKAVIDTGRTRTEHQLQAVTAVLATTPDAAAMIQAEQDCPLRFVAFDILKLQGEDLTGQPFATRLDQLQKVVELSTNVHIEVAETVFESKRGFHERLIAEGKEGTVWKQLEKPYEPGRRVSHWLKRKREIELEAVVTDFTLGSVGTGNENLIGALEFSAPDDTGALAPVARVSNFSTSDRRAMSSGESGTVALNTTYIGRRAVIAGQEFAARSGRIRHARLVRWSA